MKLIVRKAAGTQPRDLVFVYFCFGIGVAMFTGGSRVLGLLWIGFSIGLWAGRRGE